MLTCLLNAANTVIIYFKIKVTLNIYHPVTINVAYHTILRMGSAKIIVGNLTFSIAQPKYVRYKII